MKLIKEISLVIIVGAILGLILTQAIERQEKYECQKWQGWLNDYSLYVPADWQKTQCGRQGINLGEIAKEAEAVKKEETKPKEASYHEIYSAVFGYNSEIGQTDSEPFIMASGKRVYDGAIACPTRMPFGAKVVVKGKVFTCEDRMAERYRDGDYFDIWFASKEDAKNWGVVYTNVKIYD